MSSDVGHYRLRALSIAMLVIVAALIALPAALPAMQATPDPASAEADLIRATERERLRALVEADLEVAATLHSDDFQLINPAGVAMSNEEYLGAIASGAIDHLVFDPTSESAVRLYDQAAVIRYRSRIDIVVDGQALFDQSWHTDLYEMREGRWQIVWSQMTRIAQP